MTNFDDDIKSFKAVSAYEISQYFTGLFASGVIQLLEKLGYGEGMPFKFEEKKKKMRFSCRSNDIISIEFERVPEDSSYSCWYLHGYYFKVVYVCDIYGERNIMNIGPETPEISWWSDVYNYLRIEYNSMKRKKK